MLLVIQTLERSYLLRINGKVVERPQHMLMRVSVGIHKEVGCLRSGLCMSPVRGVGFGDGLLNLEGWLKWEWRGTDQAAMQPMHFLLFAMDIAFNDNAGVAPLALF